MNKPEEQVTEINLPTFRPKQQEVLDIYNSAQPGERTVALFGGEVGGGKSATIGLMSLYIAWQNPGASILIARDTLASLKDTTQKTFTNLVVRDLPRDYCSFNANEQTHTITFDPDAPPSTIYWRPVHEIHRVLSAEYTAIFLDEADQIPEESYSTLLSRLRQIPGGVVPRWFMLIASNPWPGWYADLWNDGWIEFDRQMREDGIGSVHRVVSSMEDNSMDAGYRKFMKAGMTDDDYERFGLGMFTNFKGKVFRDFTPKNHVMTQEFLRKAGAGGKFPVRAVKWQGDELLIPDFKQAVGGLDFAGGGVDAHNSAGNICLVTPSNRDVIAFEFAEKGADVGLRQKEWMREMRSVLGRPIQWVADKTQPLGISLLRSDGFSVTTNQGKKDSWAEAVKYMRQRMLVDEYGIPRFFVMEHCKQTIRELMSYRIDPKPLPDGSYRERPIKLEDDNTDCVRYIEEWLMRQRRQHPANKPPVPYKFDNRQKKSSKLPWESGMFAGRNA